MEKMSNDTKSRRQVHIICIYSLLEVLLCQVRNLFEVLDVCFVGSF